MSACPVLTLQDAIKRARHLIKGLPLPFGKNVFTCNGPFTLDEQGISGDRKTFPFDNVDNSLLTVFLSTVESSGKRVRVEHFKGIGDEMRSNVFALAFQEATGDYVIIIDKKATWCKQRFGIVKELLHIHFGFMLPEYSEDAIRRALLIASSCVRKSPVRRELGYEDFCYYCAIELFVPREGSVRDRLVAEREKGRNEYELAQALRIPRSAAEFLFEGEPNYLTVSNTIHDFLDVEE